MFKNFIKNLKNFLANVRQQYLVDPSKAIDFAGDLIAANDPSCALTEQYRNLAIALMRSENLKKSKCFLFTSPQPRDGKSTTVANLGFVLALFYKKRVLIIDGDLRRPHLHEIFKRDQGCGLYDLLTQSKKIKDCIVSISPKLDFIRSGLLPTNSSDYLASHEEISNIIAGIKDQYDYILIDSPPVLKVSDAGVLAHAADQVILIIRAEATPSNLIEQANNLLISYGCPASACVLVNHRQSVDVYSYVTNSHYRNYYSNYYKGYTKIIVPETQTSEHPKVPNE